MSLGNLGSLNPLPMQVGGGPTSTSKAYDTIRQAVGKGGSAENDRGIDGLWRRSRAQGLAAATSSTRRAALQAFPQNATDALPFYERATGIVPSPDATDAERTEAALERWTAEPLKSWAELELALKALDARFSLVMPNYSGGAGYGEDAEVVTMYGRGFDGYDLLAASSQPAFGITGGCTQYPAYSTRQVLRVLFTLGYTGALTPADLEIVEKAKRLLRGALRSDEDFQISTGPWVLDVTPIDFGALG